MAADIQEPVAENFTRARPPLESIKNSIIPPPPPPEPPLAISVALPAVELSVKCVAAPFVPAAVPPWFTIVPVAAVEVNQKLTEPV